MFETWALCEAQGLNTGLCAWTRPHALLYDGTGRSAAGKLELIAQRKVNAEGLQRSLELGRRDDGAVGVHVQGGQGREAGQRGGKVEVLGKAVELIKKQGAVAGIAGHSIEVTKACEQARLAPDFYMKTFNSKRYWSAGPVPRQDSVWEETPEETKGFHVATVGRPWIAYKVLGAGAIHPSEGFQYVFRNGADFIVRRHV